MESNESPGFRVVIRLEPGDPVAQWAARELLRLTAAGQGIGIGGSSDWGALAPQVAETLREFDTEQELLTGIGTLLVLFAGMTADLTRRMAAGQGEQPQDYLSRLEDELREWLGSATGEEA